MYQYRYKSPLFDIYLIEENQYLTHTLLTPIKDITITDNKTPLIDKACKQLDEYFNNKRTVFDLPLNPKGTEFMHKVWNVLKVIPHGELLTYKDVAIKIGQEKAYRAVGGAIGKNPLLLFIPCHRVVAVNNKLGGFSGGIENKILLIEHEKVVKAEL